MNRRLIPWFLSVTIVTIVCLLVDVTVQQSYRMNANDPQIQIAEDMSLAFSKNQFTDETLRSSFDSFTPTKIQTDIGKSLSPWIQIYDESGEIINSSATISEAQSTPKIPKGIFDEVKKRGEDRLTWQPRKGIRQAIVVTSFSGLRNGYIVAGRSLKEVEKREGELNKLIVTAWFIMLGCIGFVALWTFGYFTRFTNPQKKSRS